MRCTLVCVVLAALVGVALAIPLRENAAHSQALRFADEQEESEGSALPAPGEESTLSSAALNEAGAAKESSTLAAKAAELAATSGVSEQAGLAAAEAAEGSENAAESGGEISFNQTQTHVSDGVVTTLNDLGTVITKMYAQVQRDEKVFEKFKAKVLEDEIAKANADLSWPAIKELVSSEVAIGRQVVENEIANFQIDILDVVQRGLDGLRADLRTTITTGFIAPALAVKLPAHESAAPADPKAHTIDDRVASLPPAEGDTPNADDEGDDLFEGKDLYARVHQTPIEAVDTALRGRISDTDLVAVHAIIMQKLEAKTAELEQSLEHTSNNAQAKLDTLVQKVVAAQAIESSAVQQPQQSQKKSAVEEISDKLDEIMHRHAQITEHADFGSHTHTESSEASVSTVGHDYVEADAVDELTPDIVGAQAFGATYHTGDENVVAESDVKQTPENDKVDFKQ